MADDDSSDNYLPTETLTAEQEFKCYEEVDAQLHLLQVFLSAHGHWAEFIRTLIADMLDGREDPQRVLSISAAACETFATWGISLKQRIDQAVEEVERTFFQLQGIDDLASFREPVCVSSPFDFRQQANGRWEWAIDPSITDLLTQSEAPETTESVRALVDYGKAKAELQARLCTLHLSPSYLLERVEEFVKALDGFRDTTKAFEEWQGRVASGQTVPGSLKQDEDLFLIRLEAEIRGSCLLPGDLLKLGRLLPKTIGEIKRLRDRVIVANLWVVKEVIYEYRAIAKVKGIMVADLRTEGIASLVKCMDKFEWRRGFRFNTYAFYSVRPAIRDFLASAGQIRLPTASGRQADRVRAAISSWQMTNGRMPSAEELFLALNTAEEQPDKSSVWKKANGSTPTADEFRDFRQRANRPDGPGRKKQPAKKVQFTLAQLKQLIPAAAPSISLDSRRRGKGGEEDGSSVAETLVTELDTGQSFEHRESLDALKAIWLELPYMHRMALAWQHGLFGHGCLDRETIAKYLDVSVNEVNVIQRKGLEKYRRAILASPIGKEPHLLTRFNSLFSRLDEEAGKRKSSAIQKAMANTGTDPRQKLYSVWLRLQYKDRMVLAWNYGIFGEPAKSKAQIAQDLQISENVVAELIEKARGRFLSLVKTLKVDSDEDVQRIMKNLKTLR